MSNRNISLRNCPRCGSELYIENNFGREYWIQCRSLECGYAEEDKIYPSFCIAMEAAKSSKDTPASPEDMLVYEAIAKDYREVF